MHFVAEREAAQFLEDQNQAVGHQHLLQMVARIKKTEQQFFQQIAEAECQHTAEHDRGAQAAKQRRQRKRQVSTEHVETTVRQIDDAHDAEDQRQTAGDQEQQQAVLHRVQELDQERGEIHWNGIGE